MNCGRCDDDGYCACADFFASYRAFHRGEYDHLMKQEPKRCACGECLLLDVRCPNDGFQLRLFPNDKGAETIPTPPDHAKP